MQLKKGPVLVGAAIRLPYGEAVDSGTTLEGCFYSAAVDDLCPELVS